MTLFSGRMTAPFPDLAVGRAIVHHSANRLDETVDKRRLHGLITWRNHYPDAVYHDRHLRFHRYVLLAYSRACSETGHKKQKGHRGKSRYPIEIALVVEAIV